jgi:methionine-gamma-lyase
MTQTKSISDRVSGSYPRADPQPAWMDELVRQRQAGPRLAYHARHAGARDATLALHEGTYRDPVTRAVGSPIFQTTTFELDTDTYAALSDGLTRDVPIYTRYGNPSQWSVQAKIAALERAESALVFSSGMAAIATTLVALTNNGGHVIASYDLYGGTYNFLREDFHQFGRSVTFVDGTDPHAVEQAIRPTTQLMFFESLSNPLIKCVPVDDLGRIAQRHSLLLVVDNTLLSPMYLKPLEYGAHLVIHSCSKYLNGHSDLTAGCVAGSRKYVDRVWAQLLKLGGQLEPTSCHLLERSIKTLAIRMTVHSANAARVAAFLHDHPAVIRVHFPSVPGYSYPSFGRLCTGVGGMLSFEVAGGDEAALRFLTRLRLIHVATSLGGVESLASLPYNTSHTALSAAQRASIGIAPGLVRLSVGLEQVEDLLDDLTQALESISAVEARSPC